MHPHTVSPASKPMPAPPSTPRSAAHGFTLLELMVVVSIIAILALITLPSIRDRMVRQQVVDAMPLVDFAKQAVSAQWAATGKLPADNAAAGLPPPERIVSQFVSSVEVRDGSLVMTFSPKVSGLLAGKKITLRPATVDDYPQVPVTWLCAYANVPDHMTAHGANDTTLAAPYLPMNCRGNSPAKSP